MHAVAVSRTLPDVSAQLQLPAAGKGKSVYQSDLKKSESKRAITITITRAGSQVFLMRSVEYIKC